MKDPIEQFRDAIRAAGLNPPEVIEADGEMHRFSANGKRDDDSGWYVLHVDGIPAGAFGDWRADLSEKWRADIGRELSDSERAAYRARMDALRAAREAEMVQRRAEARDTATDRWGAADSADPAHPYLVAKGVKPHGIRQRGGSLLVQMRNAGGGLVNLQTIDADGDKRFLFGGEVSGCYFAIGKPTGRLCIVEGFATGASVHEATGDAVAVAFNAGNLKPVAMALRAKFPDLSLVLCADDDCRTAGNPGITKATEAARAVGGLVAVPHFGPDRPDKATDFNDLMRHLGAESVRQCVASASAASEALQGVQAGAMHTDDGEGRAGAYSVSWGDPRPLSVKTGPEPYPLDALPETMRAAVSEALEYYQAPLPVVVASALSVLSVAVQGVADVRRDEKLVGPTGLYLLTIAESGERKSACDRHFSTALRYWQDEARCAAEPDLNDYNAAHRAWEAKRSGVTEKIKELARKGNSTFDLEQRLSLLERESPARPLQPTPLRGDDTPENLAWALMKEWPSAGVLSSEAGSVFGSHGMGKESIMRNLALLATLWDGGSQSVGRRTSESFVMKGARFTLGLMVQESTLRTFVSGTDGLARGMGFLARFLVAWPESTQGHRPYREPAGFPYLARFNAAIQSVMRAELRHEPTGGIQPPVLDLSAEGKALWRSYHDAIEESLRPRGDLYDVRDVASKAAENIARLAAQFHVLEHGPAGSIGPASVDAAGRVMAWHLNESRRFFGELALPRELADAARLDDWLLDHCRREGTLTVATRTVQRYGPGSLRHKIGDIESAVLVLTELHRARLRTDGKRKDIEVNPALVLGGDK